MEASPPLFGPCLDCGTARVGPHCHICGQGDVDPKPTVRTWLRDSVLDAASWDHRAWRTLRVLVTDPGRLGVAWSQGKRTSFVSPVRLFLTLGVILFVLGTLYRWGLAFQFPPEAETAQTVDRMEPTARNASYWLGAAMGWLGLNAVLMLVPLVGFGYFVIFNSRRPTLPPHLVHAMHVGCVAVLGLIAWRLATLVWLATGPPGPPGDLLNTAGFGLLEVLFLTWFGVVTVYAASATRMMYGVGWTAAIATAPLVIVVPLVVIFGALIAILIGLMIL